MLHLLVELGPALGPNELDNFLATLIGQIVQRIALQSGPELEVLLRRFPMQERILIAFLYHATSCHNTWHKAKSYLGHEASSMLSSLPTQDRLTLPANRRLKHMSAELPI